MRNAIPIIALAVVASSASASVASAQEKTVEPYLAIECADLGDQPPKFESRAACRDTLARDENRKINARLKNVMRPAIHAEDANLMARNYRHVIIAYAALWILAVVFLVLLFFRQRNLTAEISRLGRELDRAIREEEEEE